MDLDELFPAKPQDPLTQVVKQDLDPLSVAELHERIATLEGDVGRRSFVQEMTRAGEPKGFSPAFLWTCLMPGPRHPTLRPSSP
jgi:uncharacterized small protein (DUF1192 family)